MIPIHRGYGSNKLQACGWQSIHALGPAFWLQVQTAWWVRVLLPDYLNHMIPTALTPHREVSSWAQPKTQRPISGNCMVVVCLQDKDPKPDTLN
jgi:hypothetical protein